MRISLYFFGIILFFSCKENNQETLAVTQGNAFGTTYTIQFYSKEPMSIEKGLDSIFNAVNQSVSTYLPTSDISKINAGDTTVQVDPIFKAVYQISEIVYTQSEKYFDPTVGVLRNAYGFGEESPIQDIDSSTLDSLRNYVGFHKVKLLETGTVKKMHPQIYFDFNAVAKGYGIDCIGNYLSDKGVENFLIELGGEVLAKGKNVAKGTYWTVGIESVNSELGERIFSDIVQLTNVGLAASGNYRKFRIDSLSGKKFVHTINPISGAAEATNVTSATVIASTCGWADAYATACMAMGLERSKKMLASLEGVEAYLTYLDEQGNSKIYTTSGFQEALLEK